MIHPRSIIIFPLFLFSNGDSPKQKFFIVLGVSNNELILASLPTSKDNVPKYAETDHGCIELPEAQFNCYVFKKGKSITDCGWSFNKTTFLYGSNLGTYSADTLLEKYPIEGIDYKIIGLMQKDEHSILCKCLKESKWVKRKYKKILPC